MTSISVHESIKSRLEFFADKLGVTPVVIIDAMLSALDSPKYREIVFHFVEIIKKNREFDLASTDKERSIIAKELEALAEKSREFL